MKRSAHLAAALLISATLLPLAGSSHAAPPTNLPKPCNLGGGSQSVGMQALNRNFRYSEQPIFQNTKSRLGTTQEDVQANFATVIENNFQSGSTEHLLNNLSDRELQELARSYAFSTQGKEQPLLKVFAQNLSDQGLVRAARAFGEKSVGEAVKLYASPNVRSAFAQKLLTENPTSLPTSEFVTPMTAPTLDMTILEIYLEFRTAPVGSVGPTAAIAETSMFAAKNIAIAASVGWAIGTQISNLIETYDPSLNDAIGGTVAGMVDATNQSWSQLRQGQYQASFDALFGYPVSNSSNPAGDFGEFQALDYYMNACY
jgi:hypothetical protein